MPPLDPTMMRVQNIINSEMFQEDMDFNWPSPKESSSMSLYEKPAFQISSIDDGSSGIPHIGQPHPYGAQYHFPRPHKEGESKSPTDYMENLAADMWGVAKGIGLTLWEGGKSAFEIARNIEHLPMIFNKTLPYEAQSHSWLTNSAATKPIFDWLDDFQVGRELRFTFDAIGDAFTNTYKDGLVEALYHHPFTVFLDATAIASLMGKGIVTAGNAAARAARISARGRFVQKISKLPGATPDRVSKVMKTWDEGGSNFGTGAARIEMPIKAKAGRIAKAVANSPYTLVKAPLSLPHNALLQGSLKNSMAGKKYGQILNSIAKTPRAQKIIGMWGSAMGVMRTELHMHLAGWRDALGTSQLSARGQRAYWNNYNQLNIIVPEMNRLIAAGRIKPSPVTQGITEMAQRWSDDAAITGKPLSNAELQSIKEASEFHRNYALNNQEAAYYSAGWLLSPDEMAKTRAHSFLVAMADDWAKAKIQRELDDVLAKGGDTEKGGMFGLYGEPVLPKARRDKIHAEAREQFTSIEIEGSTGAKALDEMTKLMIGIEKDMGRKVVPYAPYIAERTLDTINFADIITDPSRANAIQGIGTMKKRYGDAVVDLDPHNVYFKHVTRGTQVKHTLNTMRDVFYDYAKNIPISKVRAKGADALGVGEAQGYRRVMPFELWKQYFDNEDLVRTSILEEHAQLARANWSKYRDVKDGKDPGFWLTAEGRSIAEAIDNGGKGIFYKGVTYRKIDANTPDGLIREIANLDATRATIRNWSASTDHANLVDDIGRGWNNMISPNPAKGTPKAARLAEYATYIPDDVYRVVQLQLQSLTGGGRFLSSFMNMYRFMALNLHPRFYMNSFIGNAIMTLFSGSAGAKYKAALNVTYEHLPEGMQNILNQDPNRFISAQFRRNGYLRSILEKSENLMQKFSVAAEYGPRARAIAVGVEEFIANDRLLRGVEGPEVFSRGVDTVLNEMITSLRRVSAEGSTKARVVRGYLDQIDQATKLYDQATAAVAKRTDAVDKLQSPQGTVQGKAYLSTIGEIDGLINSSIIKMRDYGITDASKFTKTWKEISRGEKLSVASIYKFMEYLGHPGKSRALQDIASSAGRISKIQAYKIVKQMREVLNGPGGLLEQLNRAKYTDMYIRAVDKAQASQYRRAAGIDGRSREARQLSLQRKAYQAKLIDETQRIQMAEKRMWDLSPVRRIQLVREALDKVTPSKSARYEAEAMRGGISYMEKFFGNYNSLHPIEKKLVRNIYPFWTFPKTMALLMFRMPGLRPMTTKLMSLYSEFLLSGLDPNEIDSRLGNSLVTGADEDGNLILLRYGSWNPFEGSKLMRIGNVPIWPEGLNPINASPLLKVVLETFYGRTAWTGGPVEWGAFRTGTGQVMEPDPLHPGRMRMRQPQRPFVESVMENLLPHYRIYKEFTDPNYRIRPLPGSGGEEYPYERERWWALMRLFGVSIDVKNPQELLDRDNAYKNMLKKRIRAAYRYYGAEDRAMAEQVIEVFEENRRNGDNWLFNPKY